MNNKVTHYLDTVKELRNRIKYPVFWEINIFALILIVINIIFFPSDPGYARIHSIAINPFLLFVLFIVFRYGSNWGFYSVIISTLYFIIMPPHGMDLYRLIDIVIFFVILLFLGPIQAGYVKKIRELEEDLQKSDSKYRELNERYEINSFLKDNYERKILTQTSTMTDLYQDARNMQNLEMDGLYKEIPETVIKYVEAEKVTLYILEGNLLHLKAYAGYYDDEEAPKDRKEIREAPYNIVFEKKELISISQEKFKETVLSDMPVYIAPLKKNDGEIFGVLNVNTISFLKFNRVTERIFLLLSDWCSKAIENAMSYKISEGRRIIRPDTQIFKYEYFSMRLEEAFLAAKNTGVDFILVLIKILDWQKLPSAKETSVLKFVSRIIGEHVKDFDLLAHFEQECEFAVLKHNIKDDNIDDFISSIQKKMAHFSLKPFEDNSLLQIKIVSSSSFSTSKSLEEIISEIRSKEQSA
jgi:GGDEF domain-containing protein